MRSRIKTDSFRKTVDSVTNDIVTWSVPTEAPTYVIIQTIIRIYRFTTVDEVADPSKDTTNMSASLRRRQIFHSNAISGHNFFQGAILALFKGIGLFPMRSSPTLISTTTAWRRWWPCHRRCGRPLGFRQYLQTILFQFPGTNQVRQ
jgi:hypothetical protein